MDVALQRPIIVTSSQADKTIRVWNYLTGHCEYCKIILTEKEELDQEIEILSVAIHPNGYYMAVSDNEMIRFFHLCYRELRYYNNDSIGNESTKKNCTLLKFSNGGHLLAAISGRTLYVIKSYSRETLKEFKTPHTSVIKSIIWDINDGYVYTIGTEGLVVEYNVYNFKIEEISTKSVNNSNGCLYNYDRRKVEQSQVPNELLTCGIIGNKPVITQILLKEQPETLITTVDLVYNSMCQIRSKKFDIYSLSCGTDEGDIVLMQFPFKNNVVWDVIKAHSAPITHINFSRDTNLLFSAGADGNLFIYCLYELPDGEVIEFDEKLSNNMNGLTNIIDEGLGDNVLFPIEKIFKFEDGTKILKEELAHAAKKLEDVEKQAIKNLKEKEGELTREKNLEIKLLNDKLKEVGIGKDIVIEYYESKLNTKENEHKEIINETRRQFIEQIEDLNNKIMDLTNNAEMLKAGHVIELKKKEEDFERKVHILEVEMMKKYDELKIVTDSLSAELENKRILEEKKLEQLDEEHEGELSGKQSKYQQNLISLTQENNMLKALNKKKDEDMSYKDDELKKRQFKITLIEEAKMNLEDNMATLRTILAEKEKEFINLQQKALEYEKLIQEEKMILGFSSNLKNELYKKNTEIMGYYNKQNTFISDLKNSALNAEKELADNLRLLEDTQKELAHQKHLNLEFKLKLDESHKNILQLQNYFDSLLHKIYDIFQIPDRNKLLSGMRNLYNEYINDKVVKSFEKLKLNSSVKNELNRQIDFLQNSIDGLVEIKDKNDEIKKHEISLKTKQNAELIFLLNDLKKQYASLEKENLFLKNQNSCISKTLDNLKKKQAEEKKPNRLAQSTENLDNVKSSGVILPDIEQKNTNSSEFFKINTLTNIESIKKKKNIKGKLIRGSVVNNMKLNDENIKISEILKLIEDKNATIIKLNLEIQKLRKETKLFEESAENKQKFHSDSEN